MKKCLLLLGSAALFSAALSLVHAEDQTGGISIAPPAPEAATAPAPAATQPAIPSVSTLGPAVTQPAASAPENVLESLLKKDAATSGAPASAPADSSTLTPTVPGVAPSQPAAIRLREGQPIYNRVGRLVKDDKSDFYLFTFDSDGKDMADPPMALLPCRMLAAMESASDNGTKPVKFKVSGQVTEYHGKNFLLVTYMQTVKDLNQF